MRVKLLASATDDLYDGYRFYERQTPGLGTHYFKALFSDIDSLENHAGIHLSTASSILYYPNGFRTPYFTR